MKARVLQSSFKTALDKAVFAIENNPAMPVMGNIRLEAVEDELNLYSANLSEGYAIRVTIGANVEIDGATTVPAKMLKQLAALWSNDTVDIKLDKNTETTNFKCGGSKSNIKGIDAAEYPPHPEVNGPLFQVNAQQFKALIKSASIAAADDDFRPALTGLQIIVKDCQMMVAAADGYRLLVDTLPVSNDTQASMLIPSVGLETVAKMIGKSDDTLTFCFDMDKIGVQGAQWEVIVQQLDAKFPQFESVIPKSHLTSIQISRKALLDALKGAKVFARDSAFSVRFTLKPSLRVGDPGKMIVFGKSQERGDMEIELDTETFDGSETDFSANVQYLQEFVAQDHGDTLQLNASGPANPAVVKLPIREYPLYVIMPMAR